MLAASPVNQPGLDDGHGPGIGNNFDGGDDEGMMLAASPVNQPGLDDGNGPGIGNNLDGGDDESGLGLFEHFLHIWVLMSILLGIALGKAIPEAFAEIASWEYASINFLVAVLIWAMVYPMMVCVDFSSLRNVSARPRGLLITLTVNWLIAPFTGAGLAILFFNHVFSDSISSDDAKEYIAGLVILCAAPCTAMVFVWSRLSHGDPTYTLVQVAVNDIIMIFVFAPTVALLLNVSDIKVPWDTLLLSVVLYVVIPLIAGYFTRKSLIAQHVANINGNDGNGNGNETVARFTAQIKPLSIISLLATCTLLFGFRAEIILEQPAVVGMIAIPLFIQAYGVFFIGYGAAYALKVPYKVAAPCALIGTSNFFELAVAVAISMFGLDSGAALATVVGVLVEVPVMLSLVSFSNWSSKYFERRDEQVDGVVDEVGSEIELVRLSQNQE